MYHSELMQMIWFISVVLQIRKKQPVIGLAILEAASTKHQLRRTQTHKSDWCILIDYGTDVYRIYILAYLAIHVKIKSQFYKKNIAWKLALRTQIVSMFICVRKIMDRYLDKNEELPSQKEHMQDIVSMLHEFYWKEV